MNLIKFSNGKWGIRKGWIFHEYFDFVSCHHWCEKKDTHFMDCMVNELIARYWLDKLTNTKSTITDEVIEP